MGDRGMGYQFRPKVAVVVRPPDVTSLCGGRDTHLLPSQFNTPAPLVSTHPAAGYYTIITFFPYKTLDLFFETHNIKRMEEYGSSCDGIIYHRAHRGHRELKERIGRVMNWLLYLIFIKRTAYFMLFLLSEFSFLRPSVNPVFSVVSLKTGVRK